MSSEQFCAEIYRENGGDTSGNTVLCEPAQSTCTWTFHKSYFVWKFTGKMPKATGTTSIKCRALTPTIRTPQRGHASGHTVGTNVFSGSIPGSILMYQNVYAPRARRETYDLQRHAASRPGNQGRKLPVYTILETFFWGLIKHS